MSKLLIPIFILSLFSTLCEKANASFTYTYPPADSIAYPLLQIEDSTNLDLLKKLSYETLIKNVNQKITQEKRKKQSTEKLENQRNAYEEGLAALRATNKVIFIDSVVVNKKSFLSAYKFDPEVGTIKVSKDSKTTAFITEDGKTIYKAEPTDSNTLTINSYYIEEGKPTLASQLTNTNIRSDLNYPFLLSDGSTLYFSARTGLGNYDLYVTRYDNTDNTYLTPTNLGFPFNSYANDYMMVIDENLNIGWFASDRNQPAGKVCIYTFIQPESRHTYDYETDNVATIKNAARINSIKDTWNGNDDLIRSARQALTLKQNNNTKPTKHDFTFVLNNTYTYHSLLDFKHAEAKEKFLLYQQLQNQITEKEKQLNILRSATNSLKQPSPQKTNTIELENQLTDLYVQQNNLAKEVRRLELK